MSIDFNVDAALAKLEALATQYGPKAVDLGGEVVRVDAINNLVHGAISLGIGAIAAFLAKKLSAPVWAELKKDDILDQNVGVLIGGGLSLLVTCICAVGFSVDGVGALLDAWNWIGITQPKLALAHQILMKVSGQ